MCYSNKQQKGDYKTPEGNFKISRYPTPTPGATISGTAMAL